MTIKKVLLKASITFFTLLIVWIFLVLKYLINKYELELVNMTPLLSSFIAWIVFIYWFMLSGTIKEYRDSMDIPYQVRMYLDSILRDWILLKKLHSNFNYDELRSIILSFVSLYNIEILSKDPKMDCLDYLYQLDDVFVDIRNLWLPWSYIMTIKSKKFEIKKLVIKWYEIKKQEYMPLITQLQYAITVILIFLMLFLEIENPFQDYIITGSFVFIFVYLIFTLEIMDNPFVPTNYDIYDNLDNLIAFENLLKDNKL